MKKYESRFVGTSNSGVRMQIREVVRRHDDSSPEELERAINGLANVIAFTPSGKALLALVAEDYRRLQEREKGQ